MEIRNEMLGVKELQIARLFEIVYILLRSEKTSARELAEYFDVSTRTIYRDIDVLSGAGIPVYASRGRDGGIRLMPEFVLNRSYFSEAEQKELLAAVQSLAATQVPDVQSMLHKLGGVFLQQAPQWVTVDFSGWDHGDQERFETLRTAILQRRVISFTYYNANNERVERQAEPIQLQFKHRAWYLLAYCLKKNAMRFFKLSRIRNLALTEQTCAYEQRKGDLPQEHTPPPAVPVVLKISQRAAYRVYDEFREDAIEYHADGSFTINVKFTPDDWTIGYILSFGDDAAVLEPRWLREVVMNKIQKMNQAYLNMTSSCPVLGDTMEKTSERMGSNMENMQFCQSCSMPLDQQNRGTNKDGSISEDYCAYCYKEGEFTGDMTMEQMIDFCAPMMAKHNPNTTEQQAREQMMKFFPQLKRWSK